MQFLLFFGGLIFAGAIGIWLWNASAATREGRAFGTPNQVGAIPAGGAVAVASPGAGGSPAGAGGDLDQALVAQGQQLAQNLGCIACHTTTGAQTVGPSWKGLAGSQRQLASGQTVVADEAYLRESILQPDARIVRGFQPGLMTGAVQPLMGQLQQGNNVEALVEYIQSLR